MRDWIYSDQGDCTGFVKEGIYYTRREWTYKGHFTITIDIIKQLEERKVKNIVIELGTHGIYMKYNYKLSDFSNSDKEVTFKGGQINRLVPMNRDLINKNEQQTLKKFIKEKKEEPKKEIIKKEKIEQLWKEILGEIGENPDREGLKDTPKRIAKMYEELFIGYDETKKPKVTTFNNGSDGVTYDQMITDTGTFYSFCEHHIIPFFGKYYFAYIPTENGKLLGLSKVARVVDYFSAKLQIQERLVQEIVNCLWEELSKDGIEPLGMALIMKGEHLCKTMRGVKKKGEMTCSALKGVFKTQSEVREEFLNLIK